MLFVPLEEINRDTNSTFHQYVKHVTFAFRVLFVISVLIMLINQTNFPPELVLANIPTRTFTSHEYWRIFTAPLATLDGLKGYFAVVISFWWLLSLFPYYEKRYSTVHLFLELFIQNFIHQILYSAVAMILVQGGAYVETYNDFFFSVGWFPITIIWVFKCCSECPEQEVNFCFLPCLVKNKFLGWIIGAFFIIFSTQKSPLVVAVLVGSLQYQALKRSLVRPPYCLHRVFEKCICSFFKNSPSFISISEVQNNLKAYLGMPQSENAQMLENQQIGASSAMGVQEEISDVADMSKKVSEDTLVQKPQNRD